MNSEPVNLADRLAMISEHWSPRIISELNGQHVKIAKILGQYIWHHHDDADELFLVLKGEITIELRDREPVRLREGEIFIVPRGVEHRPMAREESHILLFEPAGVRSTGNVMNHPLTIEPEDLRQG